MTRRRLMALTIMLMLADFLAASAVFMLVSLVRFEADPEAVWSVGIEVLPAAFIFGLVWVTVFFALGLYRLRVRWGLLAEAKDIGRGTLLALAITLSGLFVFHQDNVSRLFLGLLFVVQPVVVLAGRAVLRSSFEARRRAGRDTSFMLVVGTGRLAQEFADGIEDHHALGMKVIGHLAVPRSGEGSTQPSVTRPILGEINDIHRLFRERVVDEVAVCLPASALQYLDPVITVAADEGKTVRVPRDQTEGVLVGAIQEEFDKFLVQSVVHDGQREIERAFKRLVDIVGALVGLVILSPIILGAAVAIRLRDGSPVLFRQIRVGLHGRPFTIYKFRTMVGDAEERYREVAPLSDTQGAAFKMENDPRVTPLGRTIRKWTLDELPQLLNVLKGDMSLVGPRPAPPREVDEYDIWHRRRLSVRPGMTGLWQVEARFDDHFDDRAELDLRYIDQWSLWMDLAILLRTLPAVLTPRGR
jgi:exopolysaccharide biosynthesis polyprenyl glycosylphosphotransferase